MTTQRRAAPLGGAWLSEYVAFCLGHNFAIAGALATQYALGRAHAEFEALRKSGAKTTRDMRRTR